MHGRNRTLAVSLSTFLLMGCASSPPKQPAPLREATVGSIQPSAHATYFANLLAVVTAMAGDNPNSAHRAIGARSCSGEDRVSAAAARPNGSGAQDSAPRPATILVSCQHVGATK